jgi:osmoprotectant transport system ATP-binding protein
VAGFVGRDRGYRALGFHETPELQLTSEPTIGLGATPEEARAASNDGWLLVVDDDRKPLGWVEPPRLGRAVDREMLDRGGTVARLHGPLRAVLDAALSSPSRRGVLVDDDGALAGTVRADQVLTVIERTERPDDVDADRYQQQDAS